jgi:hypothetical protein
LVRTFLTELRHFRHLHVHLHTSSERRACAGGKPADRIARLPITTSLSVSENTWSWFLGALIGLFKASWTNPVTG